MDKQPTKSESNHKQRMVQKVEVGRLRTGSQRHGVSLRIECIIELGAHIHHYHSFDLSEY
jgi:hypothetical protein